LPSFNENDAPSDAYLGILTIITKRGPNMNVLKSFYFLVFVAFAFSSEAFAQIDQVANPRAYKTIDESTLGTRQADYGVPNGHQVGDITITDIDGAEVTMSDLWGEQPLMVVFYRGGWCPFCNMQIRELSEDYAAFEEQGVTPVLISVDQPDVAALTTETYDIPFPVLSDSDLIAHEEFNVVYKLTAQEIQRAEQRGRDFGDWSGRDHESIALASSFLVDSDGVVQWATVIEDYTSRPTIEQLITAITDWKAGK